MINHKPLCTLDVLAAEIRQGVVGAKQKLIHRGHGLVWMGRISALNDEHVSTYLLTQTPGLIATWLDIVQGIAYFVVL